MPSRIARKATRVRRDLAGKIRSAAEEVAPPPDEAAAAVDTVAYIGLAGHRNLGDDAMFEAVAGLMPWARLEVNPSSARAVILGGGTLFNAGRYYLNRVKRVEPAVLPSLVFGTGFRSPEFWGSTEDFVRWEAFLHRAEGVGVRGPDSARWLRETGFDGTIDIIGDPALSLRQPRTSPTDGLVVVAPLHTEGELHGGDDTAVLDAMATTVARLRRSGHPVTLLASHPRDDRWVLEMIRSCGDLDIGYLAGYADVNESLGAIAAAELVIGERLHASVLAAAMATAFVAVEYRPKVMDFARSVGQEDAVVRTDEIGRLGEAVDAVWSERSDRIVAVAERVAAYRSLQERDAARFRDAVLVSGGDASGTG